jgi:hypothetical protein
MADVIGCQQKSAGPICIFGSDYVNTGDTAKRKSYQQPANAIRCRFNLHWLSVSLTCRHREAIFQADSFFERGIIVGVPIRGFGYETQESFHGRQRAISAH